MKSKNKKILESYDLSNVNEKEIDLNILKSMLGEVVTSGIKFTDTDNISNSEINRLAQIFPTYFQK